MEAPKSVQAQEERLYEILSSCENGVITAKQLADAIGGGVSEKAIRNAAVEGKLPFGFSHRSDLKSRYSTVILVAPVWRWFKGGKKDA